MTWKILLPMKRRPGMPVAEFRDYYETHHAPLATKHAAGIARYVRRYLEPHPHPETGTHELPWDVITEIWFDDEKTWRGTLAYLTTSIMPDEIVEDERQLFDRGSFRIATVVECDTDFGAGKPDGKQANRDLANAYFAAVANGELPDELLTADMTGWITTGGTMDKASYQRLVRLLGAMCDGQIAFTVHSLTVEDDRVVAEAESRARLIDGEDYAMTYVFVFRIRDGRIASVAEHYNPLVAQAKLAPLMARAEARLRGAA